MERVVGARIELFLHGQADLIFSVAVASGYDAIESLSIETSQGSTSPREIAAPHGARLHRVVAPPGPLTFTYSATVAGHAEPLAPTELDTIEYLRPSRYCESDVLFGRARQIFGSLTGLELVEAVRGWVHDHLTYDAAATRPTGGAAQTMDAGAGVCRDFAHLMVALLRAMDTPARVVSVYAPYLVPMDFHAVAEVLVDGQWWVADATGLAPAHLFVRIATGLDASGTAFLSQYGAAVDLRALNVLASTDQPATGVTTALVPVL
jgi:transglutaminase-like putative cysteine protease